MSNKKIRAKMVIDVEAGFRHDVTASELAFLVDEDLKDKGYYIHSYEVLKEKRCPDSNGVLPLTED